MMRHVLWMAMMAALVPSLAFADDGETPASFIANNLWMMVCTALVFIMHLGFASLEAGLCRTKNTVNILFKNIFIVCMGLLTYFVIGFNLMYPGDAWLMDKVVGFGGFGIALPDNGLTPDYASNGYTYWTDFLFQGMFAATAATIISGAVAERVKLKSFLVACTIFVTFVYPVAGSWKWGAGWLDAMGFHDFAGSTLVHSVGGWAAMVAAWMIGPRIGKYGKDGSVNPIPGSNLPLATIGTFLLWLGWFGFNGGSVLSADPAGTSFVLVTTCLAAAAGGIGAIVGYSFISSKPDVTMLLNGILAGLVGITAGADVINPLPAILVGFVAGMIVVGSVVFFDKLKIDDPVGATSVHLACGIFGTLMVGVFGEGKSFVTQLIGVGAYAAFTIVCSFIVFGAVKMTMGLRVSAEEETEGLDYTEHGMHAYQFGGNEDYTAVSAVAETTAKAAALEPATSKA